MTDTLKSVVEEELQKAYERGVQDGMKREHALWELAKIGQEIEAQHEKTDMQIGITYEEANPHVHVVDTSEERVQKTEKNEHEPVAWKMKGVPAFATSRPNDTDSIKWDALYTAPPKKEWRGLTAKDLAEIPPSCYEGAIWADAKLKEKNT